MSQTYTVWSLQSASAKGRQMADENGVPWHRTTGGPEPVRCHATWRPRQTKVLTPRSYGSAIETRPAGQVTARSPWRGRRHIHEQAREYADLGRRGDRGLC